MRIPIASFAFAVIGCGTNLTPVPQGDPPSKLDCLPNLDGELLIDELPLPEEEAKGTYWVSNRETTVDVTGTVTAAGTRRWDWSVVASSDSLVEVETTPFAGTWFASSFPRGELVVPLDLGNTVVGVLVRDANAITLLGIASATPDPPEGKTLVIYDTPIPLYVFPITVGARWSSVGTISRGGGTIDGLPFIGENRFELSVDATGAIDLPELSFTQVYRVSSTVTVKPSSGPSVSRRSVSFMFECFGEVARATSRTGETANDFRVAQEVRRLGFE